MANIEHDKEKGNYIVWYEKDDARHYLYNGSDKEKAQEIKKSADRSQERGNI